MAKKTLSISTTEQQYNSIHEQLDAYNDGRKLDDKITMSKFLFQLLRVGFKLYKMNNNDFEQANIFIDSIEQKREIKTEQVKHEAELNAENIVEVTSAKSFIKAKLNIK